MEPIAVTAAAERSIVTSTGEVVEVSSVDVLGNDDTILHFADGKPGRKYPTNSTVLALSLEPIKPAEAAGRRLSTGGEFVAVTSVDVLGNGEVALHFADGTNQEFAADDTLLALPE
ncbi:MAG TPA: hypothetical protein VGH09_12470 [Solirubrobacteraceae bacterium]|jgi:hypothetical protein